MTARFILPDTGWTYCPRCDADNMLATDPGKLYECPICHMGLKVVDMQGQPVGLEATQPLQFVELMRYQVYLQKLLRDMAARNQEVNAVEVKPPLRVRFCFKLCNFISWWFSCRVQVILDKTVKPKEGGSN